MAGTIMYAYFHGCDPLAAGEVGATDQVGKIYNTTKFLLHLSLIFVLIIALPKLALPLFKVLCNL